MKNLLQLSFIIVTHTAICASVVDSEAVQWGAETNGIQLAISLAHRAQVTNDEPVVIKVHIKNNSTNTAHYYIAGKVEFDPSWSFTVTSPSGKDVSPRRLQAFAGSGNFRHVGPGQTVELKMDLRSKMSFEEAGEYKITLKQKMLFLNFNDFFDVASDTLVVPVVKSPPATSGHTNPIPSTGP